MYFSVLEIKFDKVRGAKLKEVILQAHKHDYDWHFDRLLNPL